MGEEKLVCNVLLDLDTSLFPSPPSSPKDSEHTLGIHGSRRRAPLDPPEQFPLGPATINIDPIRRASARLHSVVSGSTTPKISRYPSLPSVINPSPPNTENAPPWIDLGIATPNHRNHTDAKGRTTIPRHTLISEYNSDEESLPTPALTPDRSPAKSSSSCTTLPSTPTKQSFRNLDGEDGRVETRDFQDELSNPEATADFSEEPKSPGRAGEYDFQNNSYLRRRLRSSLRPSHHTRPSVTPIRTPDRFIVPLHGLGDARERLLLSKPVEVLTKRQRLFRRASGASDPFSSSPRTHQESRERPRSLQAPRIIQPTRFGTGSLLDTSVESLSNGRRVSTGAVWALGGVAALAPAFEEVPLRTSTERAPRSAVPSYSSNFLQDSSTANNVLIYEKRLALALGLDQACRVLAPYSNPLQRSNHSNQSRLDNGLSVWQDREYSRITWSDNEWVRQGSVRLLEAPNLRDDYYCSVLAYSITADRLAVGLADKVYLWSEGTGVINTPRELHPGLFHSSHVTSLAFSSASGNRNVLAVGRGDGSVTLWSPTDEDPRFMKIQLQTSAVHVSFGPRPVRRPGQRCSSLLTEQEILLIGNDIGTVFVYFVDWPATRERDLYGWHGAMMLHARITIHSQQICGIVWSTDGTMFATGGNDNLCALFEAKKLLHSADRQHLPAEPTIEMRRDASGVTYPIISLPATMSDEARFGHGVAKHSWRLSAAVKAIAFCPWQSGLLAAGGGSNDRGIHFYHTVSGAYLAKIDCAAQVTSLTWSSTRREIAATFGFAQPEHPYRIAVYAWPSCVCKVKIPWNDDTRALCAIGYPGGPHTGPTGAPLRGGSSGGATGRPGRGVRGPRRGSASIQCRDTDSWLRHGHEGCIVVAGSDGSIKFHEVWCDEKGERHGRKNERFRSAGIGCSRQGLLGGSEILEGFCHGIDKEDEPAMVIR